MSRLAVSKLSLGLIFSSPIKIEGEEKIMFAIANRSQLKARYVVEKLANMKIPDRELCFKYFKKYKLPENIIKHSLKVNEVAVFLARRLKEKGVNINIAAVDRASLLHDLDKIKTLKNDKHGLLTEEILRKEGYSSFGRLAKRHRFKYIFAKLKNWEEKIVNYADKRCVHDEIVTLKQRFAYLDKRYNIAKNKKSELGKKLFYDLEKEIFRKIKLNPNSLKSYIKPKKGIIFDLGEVYLTNTFGYRLNSVAKKFKIPLGKIDKVVGKYIPSLQVHKINDKKFFNSVINELNLNTTYRKFHSLWMKPYKKYSKVDRKVYALIKNLKKNGYEIAAVSNTEPHISAYNYQRKLFNVFDHAILSYEVGMRKPNQSIYKHALKLMRLSGRECVFIDDYPENLIPARKLGMETILFKSAEQLKEELEQLNIRLK